jgi:hypothetical protein
MHVHDNLKQEIITMTTFSTRMLWNQGILYQIRFKVGWRNQIHTEQKVDADAGVAIWSEEYINIC